MNTPKLISKALFILSTILSIQSFAFANNIKCPSANARPLIISAVMQNWSEESLPATGQEISLKNASELYVMCVVLTPSADGTLGMVSGIELSALRKDAKDLESDPAPNKIDFETFKSKGYQYTRNFPFYGDVLINQIVCNNCDKNSKTNQVLVRFLAHFSLLGQGQSDYREMPFTLKPNSNALNYNNYWQAVKTTGSHPVHVLMTYPGAKGIEKVTFAHCVNSDSSACISDRNSAFTVVETLDLQQDIQKRVKIRKTLSQYFQ